MGLKLYEESDIAAIADAIRGKTGGSDTYKASEMAQAIADLPSGGGDSLDLSRVLDDNPALHFPDTPGELTIHTISLASSALSALTGLTKLTAPELEVLGYSSLANCSALEELYMPSLSRGVLQNCMIGLSALKILDIGCMQRITTPYVKPGTAFDTLIVRSIFVPSSGDSYGLTLSTSADQWLASTQFGSSGTGGKVYVPQTLIAWYETATNWAGLWSTNANNQLLPIEGSPYELD